MNKKISVVIPVYNGTEYIDQLFDCLSRQTYRNFEAIMIDDFSTDDSFEKMKKFESMDHRFKAVQVEQKGGCAVKAQVQALQYCTGDYYFYASQDDFFDCDMFEKCIEKAEETGAEVVLPDMVLFCEGEEPVKTGQYPLNDDYSQTITGKEAFQLSLDWQIHGFALRDFRLFSHKEFKADYYNSEELYFREMLTWTNKVAFCKSNFYYRQDNTNAITKTKQYFHVDILTTDIMLLEVMMKQGYRKKDVFKRLLALTRLLLWYIKNHGMEKYPVDQKKYVLKSLKNSGVKILKNWLSFLVC